MWTASKKGNKFRRASRKTRSKIQFFYQTARELKDLIEAQYDINISKAELYYLTLIIASNSNPQNYSLVTSDNIGDFIDDYFISLTKNAVRKLEEVYYLDPFDNTFIVNFTIHIDNMIQRARNNLSMKNPLTINIKTSYPLIYDMAVYLASEIGSFEKITISEDEITFIAFYIGAYLEKNKSKVDKITATFVYAQYHNLHQIALTHLKEELINEIMFVKIVPVNEANQAEINSDIVISTIDLRAKNFSKDNSNPYFPNQSGYRTDPQRNQCHQTATQANIGRSKHQTLHWQGVISQGVL